MAPEPSPRHDPRYRSLDVWRGLACLMVVLDHSAVSLSPEDVAAAGSLVEGWARRLVYGATHLALGPPVFFVISGYCIAASVDSLRRKGKSPTEFLLKRLWRTFPPYWVALGLFAAVVLVLEAWGLPQYYAGSGGLALINPRELDWAHWLGNLTLTETWRPLLVGTYPNVLTRVAWTLCYQEQFYFVCFLAVLLAPRRLYAALAGLTAGAVAFRVAAWDIGMLHRLHGIFPIYWHEFAVGLAVYWHLNVAEGRRTHQAVLAGLAALMAVSAWHGLESTLAAGATGLALIALREYDSRLAEAPRLGFVRGCGRRCFSIYLIHLPVCSVIGMALYQAGLTNFWARVLIALPIGVALAVAAGWLFYHLVERHFLSLPSSRPAARPGHAVKPRPLTQPVPVPVPVTIGVRR